VALALAAVAAVILIAGGIVLAGGSGDDDDTASPAADSAEAGSESPSGPGGEAGEAGEAAEADTQDDEGGAEQGADGRGSEASGDEDDGGTSASEDDGDSSEDDAVGAAPASDGAPVEAAEAFFDAVSSGDCEGMVSRMTPASYGAGGQTAEQAVTECEADAAGTATAAVGRWEDVRLVSVDGDEATIAVTLRTGAQEAERELPMALVDGTWKMNLDITAAEPSG
jgi:hypothetical protein